MWGAFLGACIVHKNVVLAEEASQHLLELDPSNGGYNVVFIKHLCRSIMVGRHSKDEKVDERSR